MRVSWLLILLLTALPVAAEEFRLDEPDVRLEWLQSCRFCRQYMDVTGLPSSALVSCPACARVQQRREKGNLLPRVVQICPGCGVGLNLNHLAPGKIIRCSHCQTPQHVVEAALLGRGEGNYPASKEPNGIENSATPSSGSGVATSSTSQVPNLTTVMRRRQILTDLRHLTPSSHSPAREARRPDQRNDKSSPLLERQQPIAQTFTSPLVSSSIGVQSNQAPSLTNNTTPKSLLPAQETAGAQGLVSSVTPESLPQTRLAVEPFVPAAESNRPACSVPLPCDKPTVTGDDSPRDVQKKNCEGGGSDPQNSISAVEAFRRSSAESCTEQSQKEEPDDLLAEVSKRPEKQSKAEESASEVTSKKVSLTSGFGQVRRDYEPPRLRTVAMVNGRPVTADRQDLAVSVLLQEQRRHLGQYARTPSGQRELMAQVPAIKQKVLERLIDEELVIQKAEQEGLKPSDPEVLAAVRSLRLNLDASAMDEALLERVRRDMMIQRMRIKHSRSLAPSPGDVRAYYQKHRSAEEFQEPKRVRLRSVVIYKDRRGSPRKESAATVMRSARDATFAQGDFVGVVRGYSEGPFAETGGLLRIAGEELVPLSALAVPLQRALQQDSARVGAMVGPVELVHALVWVRVEARSGGEVKALREVYSLIEERLVAQKRKAVFKTYVRLLRRKADIRVY